MLPPLTDNTLGSSPYFTMTPSFGITSSHPTKKKSNDTYWKAIKLDFYLDFNCCKPKLNWSSVKFDSVQIQISHTNLSTPIVRSTLTSGPITVGKPTLSTGKATL